MSYHMIVEQTIEYKKRMKYNPKNNLFDLTEDDSLFYSWNMPYPYGWIKESGAPPEKHLDVILVCNKTYSLGDTVEIKIIGIFKRQDKDHKIVAVPKHREVTTLDDLYDYEIKLLKRAYPKIGNNEGWFGRDKALKVLNNFIV